MACCCLGVIHGPRSLHLVHGSCWRWLPKQTKQATTFLCSGRVRAWKLLRCRGSTQAVAARRVLIGLIGTLALVRLLGDGNRQLAATASTACTIILAIATAYTLLTLASGHGV